MDACLSFNSCSQNKKNYVISLDLEVCLAKIKLIKKINESCLGLKLNRREYKKKKFVFEKITKKEKKSSNYEAL